MNARAKTNATRRTSTTRRTSSPPKPSSSKGNGYGGARSAVRGILELGGIEFVDDIALIEYLRRTRDLAHAFAAELEFGGYQLEGALRGIRAVPGMNGIRARKVSKPLLVAAEAARIIGAKAVECNGLFNRYYAPEIEAVRGPHQKEPTFEIRPDGDTRM
jgi:hypothetical protein